MYVTWSFHFVQEHWRSSDRWAGRSSSPGLQPRSGHCGWPACLCLGLWSDAWGSPQWEPGQDQCSILGESRSVKLREISGYSRIGVEREKDRERQTERDTHTETDRDRRRQTDRQTDTQTHRWADICRDRETEKEGDREIDGHTPTQTYWH